MTPRRFLAALLLTAAFGAAVGAEKTARVTYVTGVSIYIDAGRDDGLAEGDVVQVVRKDQAAVSLTVIYLSSHRASCSAPAGATAIVVGDTVRYTPRAVPAAAAATAAPAAAPAPRSNASSIHGRVGARYLTVKDRTGFNRGYDQPELDLLLAGRTLGGAPVDLDVDARATRTTTDLSDGSSSTANEQRVYRLAATVHLPGEGGRITAGRQFAPSLSALSLFDGVTYAAGTPRWGGGVFAGFQPDLVDLGFSTDVTEYGGYVEVHNLRSTRARWSFVSGLVSSMASGEVNRDFIYLQGHYFDQRIAFFSSAVVDFNRGWKKTEAGESTIELTGGFASLRYTVTRWLRLFGGYDNRRNVRTIRDRLTPVAAFDESFRRGGWIGGAVSMGRHVEATVEARDSRGGPSGSADAYSISVVASGMTRASVGCSARATHFSNVDSSGDLYALGAGVALASFGRVELNGGRQTLDHAAAGALQETRNWYGVDLDFDVGRRWFLFLSIERDTGTPVQFDQAYAGVTYRF